MTEGKLNVGSSKPEDLTDEQKIILRDIFQYRDKAEITKEELELAKTMFDTPEKFALLRKIFQVLMAEERGITMPSPEALIEADPTKAQEYAFIMAANIRADEIVRNSLVAFYRQLRGDIQEKKKKEFIDQNKEEFEEKKRSEEYEEEQESKGRIVGPNL